MAEPHEHTEHRAPAGRGWLKWLLGLLIGAAVVAYVVKQLPGQAYPTDLSRIGAGTATLVLARDIGFVGGAEVMELMNELRPSYSGRMEFLATNLKLEAGAAFAAEHGMRDGSVVMFDAQGRRRGVLHMPPTADSLRAAIDQVLAAQDGAAPQAR